MHETWTLTKRELHAYFDGPAAYVVLSVFLAITGWFFGSTLFLQNLASLRSVFTVAPFIFLFASGYLIIGVATLRDKYRQSAIEAGERVLAETSVNVPS